MHKNRDAAWLPGVKLRYWRIIESIGQKWERACTLSLDVQEQVRVLFAYLFSRARSIPHKTRENHRNALFISYYSAPYKSMYGTQRVGKFMKYLTADGWDISLLTTAPEQPNEKDEKAEPVSFKVHVVRLPKQEPRALGGRHLLLPDDFIRWVLPAAKAAEEIVMSRGCQVIYATVPPYSNLMAGVIASHRCGIPLVADFRDPWTKIDVGWVINGPILRAINQILERKALYVSHSVVMADDNRYWRTFFASSSKALRKKVISITNGYDEEDFAALPQVGTAVDRFTISYVGTIYDDETFENLGEPLRLWARQFPEDMDKVRLIYAGSGACFFSQIEELGIQFVDHGYVTHREAIALRLNSQVQLFSQPRYFKPHVASGKIYEMVRVGVPILARTHRQGAVAHILEKTGAGYVVPQGNHGEAAAFLKKLFEKWKNGELLCEVNNDAIKEYSRTQLAAKLAAVLEKSIGDNKDKCL